MYQMLTAGLRITEGPTDLPLPSARVDQTARQDARGNDMGAHFSGDMQPVSNVVDDGAGHVSFDIDVNGDLGGSTHNGTVTGDGSVKIVSEERMDGAGNFFSQVNGDIYEWRTQCGATVGVHYVIELAYSQS